MTPRIDSIHIEFINPSDQRYPTLGDWTVGASADGVAIRISITRTPDQRYSWPIALHEMVEALLCHVDGITTEAVDAWDIHGPGRHLSDPGADPKAPYHSQHMAADDLEFQFAQQLGFSAREYSDYVDGIAPNPEQKD